jgi:hypothetical protein
MKLMNKHCSGVWWNVLVEVATAVYSADNGIKKQWLLDALDTGCVTAHPSTVYVQLQYVLTPHSA